MDGAFRKQDLSAEKLTKTDVPLAPFEEGKFGAVWALDGSNGNSQTSESPGTLITLFPGSQPRFAGTLLGKG